MEYVSLKNSRIQLHEFNHEFTNITSRAHPGYFENRIPIKPVLGGGGGAYAASQITVLHMKGLNQTESPIFVILCVLCFQRQSFFTSS